MFCTTSCRFPCGGVHGDEHLSRLWSRVACILASARQVDVKVRADEEVRLLVDWGVIDGICKLVYEFHGATDVVFVVN